MLIEGNALKIRTIRSILVKSGDIGQNFRTLSFSERCFDTQTKYIFRDFLPTGIPIDWICMSVFWFYGCRKPFTAWQNSSGSWPCGE